VTDDSTQKVVGHGPHPSPLARNGKTRDLQAGTAVFPVRCHVRTLTCTIGLRPFAQARSRGQSTRSSSRGRRDGSEPRPAVAAAATECATIRNRGRLL